ncbi:hypothetical protein H310_15174 [Aphanomyces invadans]|uniref:Uncharacterized protein n=1 Tax=Aphanomyces invadans TaxID=157072 RepID=A0A024T8Q0_9STRA|nr:hypothetical protein H310_15174 [Aphanomyces invadans]ETV89986.1 hypothetical protein H310_15174 [Aphanomyces invadans]|eukprot:XP_008881382.1 hypothetical protein H310_15174 [Aphanomyces invadans]
MSSLVTNAEAFTSSDIYEKYKDFVLRLTARDPRRQRLFQASFEMFALEQANFDSSSDDDLSAPRTSPPDSDDEVEVESTPKRGQKREVESLVKPRSVAPSTPRAPIVLDAEALKRLDHRLRQFWERHAKVVWSRYFWIGYGHYREAGYVVDQSANHPKADLSRAKKAWLLLVTDLYRMEGHSVFQYLYEAVRGSDVVLDYLALNGSKRWPDFAAFPEFMSRTKFSQYSLWARDTHSKGFAWCGELFETAGSRGWARRTAPFPYVRHDSQGIFCPPCWLREQSTTEKNQTGRYAVLPDHQRVELLSDHSAVVGSGISGLPGGGSPSSAITL